MNETCSWELSSPKTMRHRANAIRLPSMKVLGNGASGGGEERDKAAESFCAVAIGLPPRERDPRGVAFPWLTIDNLSDKVTAVCVTLSTDVEVKHSGWALVVNGKAFITQVLWVCTTGLDVTDPLAMKEVLVTINGLRRISGRRSQPLRVAKGKLRCPMGHALTSSELNVSLRCSLETQAFARGGAKISMMTGNQLFGPRHLVLESLSVR